MSDTHNATRSGRLAAAARWLRAARRWVANTGTSTRFFAQLKVRKNTSTAAMVAESESSGRDEEEESDDEEEVVVEELVVEVVVVVVFDVRARGFSAWSRCCCCCRCCWCWWSSGDAPHVGDRRLMYPVAGSLWRNMPSICSAVDLLGFSVALRFFLPFSSCFWFWNGLGGKA